MTEPHELVIDHAHPSLAGHFPGEPIVPGAILLDHAICHVERIFGRKVAAIPIAKFLVPVRPKQTVVFSIKSSDADRVSLIGSASGANVFSVTMTLEGHAD
jgi:3-hydroxyacyl-[acyl-carrier-protein] dehydratase